MNEAERHSLLPLLRPKSKFDFSIAASGFIEAADGEFVPLTPRCWIILAQAMQSPLGFSDAELLLNQGVETTNEQKEILLDRKASEYIVYATNVALKRAKSVHRLSAKGECFAIR